MKSLNIFKAINKNVTKKQKIHTITKAEKSALIITIKQILTKICQIKKRKVKE